MAAIVFTVEKLAQVAFRGATSANSIALQSLLQILIDKLNIKSTLVEFEGLGDEYFNCVEDSATPSIQVEFSSKNSQNVYRVRKREFEKSSEDTDNTFNTIDARVEKLENLLKASDYRIAELQTELYNVRKLHARQKRVTDGKLLQEIVDKNKSCKCADKKPNLSFCYDLSDPFNEVAVGLLSNTEFVIEMMKKISCPILDKISNWENQIEILGNLFQKFLNRAEEEFQNFPNAQANSMNVKQLKLEFDEFQDDYIINLQEIQDMLDAKLDKVHIPPMKKYITDEFTSIYTYLESLRKNEDCGDGLGTTKKILEDLNCISCGEKVCQRTAPFNNSIFYKVKESPVIEATVDKAKDEKLKAERKCGGLFTIIKPEEKIFRRRNLADEFNVKVLEPKVTFMEGKDGNMYRVDPVIPICTCAKRGSQIDKEPTCPCPKGFHDFHIEEEPSAFSASADRSSYDSRKPIKPRTSLAQKDCVN